MSLEEFESLNEEQKKIYIFEAEKITESKVNTTKVEIFKIDQFFVEARTSLTGSFKRMIRTLRSNDLSKLMPD